jgi:hypothetical protein
VPVRDEGNALMAAAGYRDWKGAYHHRHVRLQENGLKVQDRVRGFSERAVLRWRLQPGKWQLKDETVRCGAYSVRVSADVPIVRCELVKGWESRYYLKKTPLPVLEVEIHTAGTLWTQLAR